MDTTERYDLLHTNEFLARVRQLHDSCHRLVQIGCLNCAPAGVASPAAAPEDGAPNADTQGDIPAAAGGKEGASAVAPTSPEANSMEIIYSFDKDFALVHLRLTACSGDRLPSISSIYDSAFLYENEIHDLFGLSVEGISVDFKGTLYQKRVERPFAPVNGAQAGT